MDVVNTPKTGTALVRDRVIRWRDWPRTRVCIADKACRALLTALILFVLAAPLAGCGRARREEAALTTPAVATATAPLTPTLTPEATVEPSPVGASVYKPGQPRSLPILYKMFDYGTDFQRLRPELGPIGSVHWTLWRDVNPGRNAYNWSTIDDRLKLEEGLKVTLPDGRQVPKPVVIQVMSHLSSAPEWVPDFYDGTPRWVYDLIDSENPGSPRPIVQGMKVGYALQGCDGTAVVPMYGSERWRNEFYKMVRALGRRYNGHPQIAAVVICTGLDGETQIVKDWKCNWDRLLDQQASDARYGFGKFMDEVMREYHQAFPDTPIYISNAPGGSGIRKHTSDYAATFDPPIGLKHHGLWVDLESHKGYGNFVGSWDMINTYSRTLPIWLESVFGMGNKEHRYWSYMAGLHYHPDAMDLHPEFFTQSDPEWLRFVVTHLGVDIENTPDVWTVLRDAEYPRQDWGAGGISGHPGDWTFWLTRLENAPQSATERVMREGIPAAARDHVYSRQARRTRQGDNHIFMSFDIDDAYPYVDHKPVAMVGGNVHYNVYVTILNLGKDTFSLEYRNWDGGIVTQTRTKGKALGLANNWVTVKFEVRDGYLNNNMPGRADFRVSSERDGDEYIHMVRVEGGWGEPPPPTATPSPTVPPPTPTPSLTPTGPTPTPSGTPTVTPTPPPPTLVATPTLMPGAVLFSPAEDVFLDQWAPSKAWGTEPRLAIRQNDIKTSLLRFDLSQIPSPSQPGMEIIVDQAVLNLCIWNRTNLGYLSISAHKVLRPWREKEATWLQAKSDAAWTVAGCNDPERDRSAIVVDELTLTADNYWVPLDLTELVQDWIREPERNYGVVVKGGGGASVEYSLYSADYSNPAVHPQLWVRWHEAAPVTPTPTATRTPKPGTPTKTSTPPPGGTWTPTPAPAPGTAVPSMTPTGSVPGIKTIVFRQGSDIVPGDRYSGAHDTFLDGWFQDDNREDSGFVTVRQGSVKVPLVRFDTSRIPETATVLRATLHLYVMGRSNIGELRVGMAKVNRRWDPFRATWLQSTATEGWSQPGARDVESDRSAKLYATGLIDGENYWTEWDLTELVHQWVTHPEENHGILLTAEGGVSVQYDIASSNGNENTRPRLEVEFSSTGPIPTPTLTRTPTKTPFVPTPTNTLFPPIGKGNIQHGVDGYEGFEDTYVDGWHERKNYAADERLLVRQGGVRSPLIRFDLKSLPTNAVIKAARLQVYIDGRSGTHALPIRAVRVLLPWRIDEATYLRASRERAWSKEGIAMPGRDISIYPLAEKVLDKNKGWVTFEMTDLVQEWVAHPEYNHGLVIKGDGSIGVEYGFLSSDWPHNPELRPKLFLNWEYTPPTATPTRTPTPSATPTLTSTPSSTATITPTPSPTPTDKPYPPPPPETETAEPSATASATARVSPTRTRVSTRTRTATKTTEPSPSPSASATPVPSRTATPTTTRTATLTPTETAVPSPTPTALRRVLQNGLEGYRGVSDTYLDAWNWQTAMGQSGTLKVRRSGVRSVLIRFDLPEGSKEFSGAALHLWVASRSEDTEMTVRAYVLTRPWDENTATWLESETGVLWAKPGADGTDGDREAPHGAEALIPEPGKWISLNVSEAVHRWIDDPRENYGLVLHADADTRVEYAFASSQWSRSELRPKLVLGEETDLFGASVPKPARALESLDILLSLGAAVAVVGAGVLVAYPLRRLRRSKGRGRDIVR